MKLLHLVLLLHFTSTISGAVEYKVLNAVPGTPGGSRFDDSIGVQYTQSIMQNINYFIWDMLQQYDDSDRKPVETVSVYIQEYDGAEAVTYGEIINVSSIYLAGYEGDVKWEFTSLLHHEMTHVFQWNGEGQTPVGLVEGMADYMILKSNYYPEGFAGAGQGERWDQGYDFTARFLEYCEELRSGFVAGLNKKTRFNYTEEYFVELTGKTVGQLWDEYKAKYGGQAG